MGTLKSQTQIFLSFYEKLLKSDMVRHYGDVSFNRDFDTLKCRVEKEGNSFLLKTLPLLGKAIDLALVTGRLTCPSNFKRFKRTAYPHFLRGLLSRVFDEDGTLKKDPCISAVRDLRQVCYLLYKYDSGSTKNRNKQIENFQLVDTQNGWVRPSELDQEDLVETKRVCLLARTLLSALFRNVCLSDILPKHGPGAVATGEKNWDKMGFKTLYTDLHRKYPYYKYFFSNAADLAANVSKYKGFIRQEYGIAKLLTVPKDSRGERIISMEPLEYMWIQQGIKDILYSHIESHPLTRGKVNFTNQNVNRDLALAGSISNDIVTLDMKEASDRISLWLVEDLFSETDILENLLAARTKATMLPDGTIHQLRMFAPMGSALCFPIMSLVHWALAVSTLNVCSNLSLRKALAAVYVYGDDIVIKGENHVPLYRIFESLGLKFNEQKCCTTGIFRESCGMDAALGECVTPIRLKKRLPASRTDASGYLSYIKMASAFFDDGYYALSNAIESLLVSIYGTIPFGSVDSDVPCLTSNRPSGVPLLEQNLRFDRRLQKSYQNVRTIETRKIVTQSDRCEYHRKLVTPDGAWRRQGVAPRLLDGHISTCEHALQKRDTRWIYDDPFQACIYTEPRSVKFKKGKSYTIYGVVSRHTYHIDKCLPAGT